MALIKTQLFEKMDTATRNALSPLTAQTIYNTDTSELNYWDGAVWVALSGGGSGTVTSVTGTANRITITGTPTIAPIVDIASTYVGQSSITTLGTIGTGVWQGSVVTGQYGGTGVNNNGKTITLGGNFTTSGAFASTLTLTGVTNVTLPTTGTLITGLTIGTTPITSGTVGRVLYEGAGSVVAESSSFNFNDTDFSLRVGGGDLTPGYVNFLGFEAGKTATDAIYSNFIGKGAGNSATKASNSIFIGQDAGNADTVDNTADVSNYSILIGPTTSTGGFTDSVAIGGQATNTAVNQMMIGSSAKILNLVVPFGSVGIGTDNPSVALEVVGAITASGQCFASGAGSAGAPSLAIAQTNLGFYQATTDEIGVTTGGTERFRFSSSAFKSATTAGPLLRREAGAAATPTYAFNGTVGTGMWLNGTSLGFSVATTEYFDMTNDGRFYGKSLHNNAGAMTGATNQYIGSGTYTPTLTNTTNIAASTARLASWTRVGNVVTVAGQLDIDPTAAGAVLLGISLPIASNFTTAYQLGGTGSSIAIANESYGIEADATNDRASMKNIAVDVTNHKVTYTFSYEVL